jgi:SOS-response transcriptional repressor LexA
MKTTITRLMHAVTDRESAWNRRILKKELAQAAGVTSSAVSFWLNNEDTELKAECVFGLAKFLRISAEWLQSGKGDMLAVQHDPAFTDSLNTAPKTRKIVKSTPDDATSITEKKPAAYGNFDRAAVGYREIPVISYVQAGMMTEAIDPFSLGDGFEVITTDLDLSGGAFGLIIRGPSMEPEFKEGDKVIIDPAVSAQPGDFVVAKNTQEEATFKKYRPRGTSDRGEMVFELVPLNDDFATLHSERDHLHIIGVMVEHRKYRRR